MVTAARSAGGTAANVNSILVDLAASLRTIIQTTGVISEVTEIATVVEEALPAVTTLLRCWHDGEVLTVAEIDALTMAVKAMHSALILARTICVGANVIPLAGRVRNMPLH